MAKKIMIQGTMSNVGKSLIVAGLCRIFKQDGYEVAPFKSQNMALNSAITKDGYEMGRAQVIQAEAAGKEPDVRMNPILLKPTTHMNSQVIVNGKAIGMMSGMSYYEKKRTFLPKIEEAFSSLEKENDIIVIEGAGSPAEINLRQHDIVNMGLAELVKTPVLLVGDIDRGGVFAQLLGTMMLLEESEQKLVKGMIVNKFRGDRRILEPGLVTMEEKMNLPFLGVVPFMDVDIEEEDSLSSRFLKNNEERAVKIAIIKLPHISNYTDFHMLEKRDEIALSYISKAQELVEYDFIVLPGSKNTMEDLLWLRSVGLEKKIKEEARKGTLILGICGGYQILGEKICDPNGYENGGEVSGMQLMSHSTYYQGQKRQVQTKGVLGKVEGRLQCLSGMPYDGYEVHMGLSDETEILVKSKEYDNVYGTYVHGIFDIAAISEKIVGELLNKKGITLALEPFENRKEYMEKQYDYLAKNLRESLDMDKIYEILNNGI